MVHSGVGQSLFEAESRTDRVGANPILCILARQRPRASVANPSHHLLLVPALGTIYTGAGAGDSAADPAAIRGVVEGAGRAESGQGRSRYVVS